MKAWMLVLAWSALPALAAASPCDSDPVKLDVIDASIGRLERAWASMDSAGVQYEAGTLVEAVRCAAQPFSPTLAARVHRSLGLAAVTRGDQQSAALAFASARLASPEVRMGEALAPPGSVVARLYERPPPALPAIPLEPVRQGTILVDGQVADTVPAARPLILQHLAPRGDVLGSWWLEDASDLPPEPWADPHRGARRATRYGGVGALLLGVAAFGVAAGSASAHANPDVDRTPGELARWRDASRAGTLAGAGLLLGGSTAVAVSFSGALR